FVPAGVVRHLHVTNVAFKGFKPGYKIPSNPLSVIEVVLKEEIVASHPLPDPLELLRGGKEYPRRIEGVYRLDLELYPRVRQPGRGEFQIGDKHVLDLVVARPRRPQSGHAIDLS